MKHVTSKTPSTRRIWERSKGDAPCPTTFQNHQWHPSCLSRACSTRKDLELKWLARDNPETTLITIKPETVSHVAEQFSSVLLPYCFLPCHPFPTKSLTSSAGVSPWTFHFWVFDWSPLLAAGRGAPSCSTIVLLQFFNWTPELCQTYFH